MLKYENGSIVKTVWISAIPDKGTHLFIKAKISIEPRDNGVYQELLQQTIYFNHNKELKSMYQ